MPYYDTPQAADRINATQPLIQANFATINTDFSVDHIGFDAAAHNGKHKKITLVQQAAAPAFAAGEIGLYNLAGALLYHNLAGVDLNISARTAQSVTLPSGLIIKYGESGLGGVAGSITIPFTTHFPVVCYTVVVSLNDPAAGYNPVLVALQSKSVNSFTVKRLRTDTGAPTNYGFNWIALGA